MKYRKLGASDLQVSEISLGSWLTYGVGVQQDAARACVDRAFDLGINFIDTANVYGRGAAESVLGETLAGRKRDSYVLATKVFGQMSDTDQGLSRVQIEKQIDATQLPLKDPAEEQCREEPPAGNFAARNDGLQEKFRHAYPAGLPCCRRTSDVGLKRNWSHQNL